MIRPYLNFDGNCEAAFELYRRAFGGEIEYMEKYGAHAPKPEMKDLVRHAEMRLTETGGLTGGDATWPYEKGGSVNILLRVPEEKAKEAWKVLSQEGVVLSELAPFEEGGLMGSLKDKYGFIWIFTVIG